MSESLLDTSALYSYQVRDAEHHISVMRKWGASLDGAETGVGKTRISLAVCRQFGIKPLVIAPKAVIPAWHREAAALGGEVFAINYESLKGNKSVYGKLIDPPQWLEALEGLEKATAICEWHEMDPSRAAPWDSLLGREWTDMSHDLFKEKIKWVKKEKFWKARRYFQWDKNEVCLIIFDEVHRCKAPSSLNAKLLIGAGRDKIPVIGLSATAADQPGQMKALGYILSLHKGKNFYQWQKKYGMEAMEQGGTLFTGGKKALQQLHRDIFPEHGCRTTRDSLGLGFPECQITAELYDIDDPEKIDRLYREMEAPLAALHERSQMDKDMEHPLTALLRMRQQIELKKVPLFQELIEDALENGFSVPVFLNFNETIDELVRRLGYGHMTIRGEVNGKQQNPIERQAIIDRFQKDESRVVLCNIRAGGVGINLHDTNGNFPRLALLSPTYSAIDLVQALGRSWRQGGKTKTLQRIVLAAKTLEEKIHTQLKDKLNRLSLINDGDLVELYR